MAVYIWTGATNSYWTTSSNWKNEQGIAYSSGYPGSGNNDEDDVILSGSPTNQLEAKNASGLARLRSFRVAADYDDMVGDSSNFVQINAVDVIIQGTAAGSIRLQGNSSITNLTVLDGTEIYLKGTISNLTILKGIVTLDTATTISNSLIIGSVTDTTGDVVLTIPNITSLCSTVTANGGTVTCSEGFSTLNLNAGTWTQQDGDITTVNMFGGTFAWNGGNLDTVYLRGGELNTSDGPNARRVGYVEVYPAAVLNLDNGQSNILVTNCIKNYGGTVIWGAGENIGIAPSVTYAGASDAKLGIVPQNVNNTSVNGDAVYVSAMDRLDVYVTVGDLASGASITVKLQESETSAGTYDDIAGTSITFGDTDDNKTKRITFWGYSHAAGHWWVRAVATNSAAADAYISVIYVHHVY